MNSEKEIQEFVKIMQRSELSRDVWHIDYDD
jgi:hypothetical protein